MRSTTELRQHGPGIAEAEARYGQRRLNLSSDCAKRPGFAMPDQLPPARDDRAARLAAALRDNLHKRKARARGVEEGEAAPDAPPTPDTR